jgi:hypothetical protein
MTPLQARTGRTLAFLATGLLMSACVATDSRSSETSPGRTQAGAASATGERPSTSTTPSVTGAADPLSTVTCSGPVPLTPGAVVGMPVIAWTAVDGCRALVAGPNGLAVLGKDSEAFLDPLTDMEQAGGIVLEGGTVWVGGVRRQPSGAEPTGVLLRIGADHSRTAVRLPGGTSEILSLARGPRPSGGVVAFARTASGGQVIAVGQSGRPRTLVRTGAPEAIGVIGPLVVVADAVDGATRLRVLDGATVRSVELGRAIKARFVSSAGKGVLIAAEEIQDGAPVAAVFLVSADAGRTWSRTRLAGADVTGLAAAADGKTVFAAMTRTDLDATVFSSTDAGRAWLPITRIDPNGGLGRLTTSDGTLWVEAGTRLIPLVI